MPRNLRRRSAARFVPRLRAFPGARVAGRWWRGARGGVGRGVGRPADASTGRLPHRAGVWRSLAARGGRKPGGRAWLVGPVAFVLAAALAVVLVITTGNGADPGDDRRPSGTDPPESGDTSPPASASRGLTKSQRRPPTPPPRVLGDGDVGGPPVPAPQPLGGVRGLAGWTTVPDGARLAAVGVTQAALGGPDSLGGVAPAAGRVQVDVDTAAPAQPMAGFGAALTESSAVLLSRLPDDQRAAVLRSLFDPAHGAGLSLVRVPMGASDFARDHYTYDDLPDGGTDPGLAHFSVARDDAAVVPVLREILAINPEVRVVASPWSAPAWMKTSGQLGGGSLRPEWAGTWARYFVRFVQAYAERGIPVSAVTVQNEPGHSDPSYPTMTMSASEQAAFVATHLGPALAAARLPTQIIGYDHNWDDPGYPSALLSDAAVRHRLAGVAWHCYRGNPSAQSQVRAHFPEKPIWLTECSGGDWHGPVAASVGWLAGTVIDAARNWAGNILLWNLALDEARGPHLGGCGDCHGVLTVTPRQPPDLGSITRSLEFDLLALASRAAPRGSVRVASQASSDTLPSVAFVTAGGQRSLLLYNRSGSDVVVSVHDGGPMFTVTLPARALATLSWQP